MIVYTFTKQLVWHDEDCGIDTSVYATRDDAMAAFKQWRNEEKQYAARDGWAIEADEETRFSAYEEDGWCNNHTEGFVEEHEI